MPNKFRPLKQSTTLNQMVSFRPYGRMGNFLFMAANCVAYAFRHGLDFSMPYKTNDPFWNPIYLSHLINEGYTQGREDVLVNEPHYHYRPIEFKEEWRDKQIILNGYWQSEKYFKEFRNEILVLFNYRWKMIDDVVGVHIRRGDYLKLPEKHPPVTKEWYEEAMAMFPNKKFLFFSDDIDYCKETFGHRNDCMYSDGHDIEEDLRLMSCCESNIISSSTFGWWAAWLNKNKDKKIIVPQLWFQPGWDNMDTKDVVPEEWIKV